MQFPPLAFPISGQMGRAAGTFVTSPHLRGNTAALRLFRGAVPPTLSIRDQIAVAVAERIVLQRLAPGQRLSEQTIADEFRVSKAPVGEALNLLRHEGLVETAAHRSPHVAPVSVQDFDDLLEFRAALAKTFVPRYVLGHEQSDQEVLQRYFEQMGAMVGDDAQAFEFVELSDRCMLFLALQAGNARIASAMCSLSLQLLRYLAMAARTVRQRRLSLDRWIETAEVLATRDIEKALAHLDETRATRGADIRSLLREPA